MSAARPSNPFGRCRSCDKSMRWYKTPAGKSIPLDPDPVPDGNVYIKDGRAIVVRDKRDMPPDVGGDRFFTHFTTCPERKKWSGKRAGQAGRGDVAQDPDRVVRAIREMSWQIRRDSSAKAVAYVHLAAGVEVLLGLGITLEAIQAQVAAAARRAG